MDEFKVMKELIKALTYIGDAIAGTNKSSNSQSGSDAINDDQGGSSEGGSSGISE